MSKYKNSRIYEIRCNMTNKIYYGSTIQYYLCDRLKQHKSNFKRWLKDNNSGYCSSFEIIKNGDYKIILVENFECKSKDELRQREQHYIDNNECINKISSYLTEERKKEKHRERNKKRYYENKDKIKKYYKQYREDNKDKIKEYRKQFREDNKEIVKEKRRKCYIKNKDKERQYYYKNKDVISKKNKIRNDTEEQKEKMKKYREEHKERLKKKRDEWRDNNKERVRKWRRNYYLENKYSYLITDYLNMLNEY